jgi:DNA polymerase-3 subunit chi
MAEVYFYHLTRSSLEAALPGLVGKCLERGWRAVLRCGGPERLEALDRLLWTHDEESFLPHGTAASADPAREPVYLTAGPEVPNGAEVLFLVDGAGAGTAEIAALTRTVLIFDGRDETALAAARTEWRRVTAAGIAATYWAQEDAGWVRRAGG